MKEPQKEPKDTIPLLAEHFLRKYSSNRPRQPKGFTHGAIEKLILLHESGSITDLENTIERAIEQSHGPLIEREDIRYPIPTDDSEDIESEYNKE